MLACLLHAPIFLDMSKPPASAQLDVCDDIHLIQFGREWLILMATLVRQAALNLSWRLLCSYSLHLLIVKKSFEAHAANEEPMSGSSHSMTHTILSKDCSQSSGHICCLCANVYTIK